MLNGIVKSYELKKGKIETYVLILENGKKVEIVKKWVDTTMKNLELDLEETLLVFLEDNGYVINEEQDDLDKKAKGKVKLVATVEPKEKKETKPRTKKENPTKELIIQTIAQALAAMQVDNLNIENKAKLVTFSLDNKDFKIDLVEKRKSKA